MTQTANEGVGKKYSDQEIEEMYIKLKASGDQVRKADPKSEFASKWNGPQFQIVSGYAVRVAKNTTLKEFKDFMHSGTLATPVKMTAAELELLQGGMDVMKACAVISTAAACVAAGACFCCA